MTLWRFNEFGDNKHSYTPTSHLISESFWRSFGATFMPSKNEELKRPGIIDWFHRIQGILDNHKIVVQTFGMEPDGNATSWVPIDEYYDSLKIRDRKSTRLNSSHVAISYAVFCLKKKKQTNETRCQ